MKIVISKNLLWPCIIIIAIDLIAGYTVFRSNQQVYLSEKMVDHTEQVIYKSENILSAGKDIESALRAFVITNDNLYLEPLYATEKSVFIHIKNLKQLTLDNPVQQNRVDSLGIYIQKQLDYSIQTITLRKKLGFETAIAFMTRNKDLFYSEQISNNISNIKRDEYSLLSKRRLLNEKLITDFNLLLEGLLVFMSLLTIALLTVSVNYVSQNKGKGRRAAELVIANRELAYQNKEKEQRAQELIIANRELSFQIGEKEKRAAELVIANNQLAIESVEKEKRAGELDIANRELHFQNEEKRKHAVELIISNEDLNKAKLKITHVSRLYDLIGKLNENIVRVKDVETLFKNACDIVLELGRFKTTWIGIIDHEDKTISLVEQCGLAPVDLPLFAKAPFQENDAHDHVIQTGKYYISNNVQQDFKMEKWKLFGETRGIHSLMILPIIKGGLVFGTLNLYSADLVFADVEEIELLERVAEDISFALDLFENAAIQWETAAQLEQNEKRYRSLIEKAVDMITLRSPEGRIEYASPAVTDVLMRSNSELLKTYAFDLIHPDDLPGLEKEIKWILKTPGSYCFRQQRYLRKDGEWIWCEGYITNLMHEPGIHALVSNFRDVSEKKKIEEQIKFDRNNLDALINNTDDLMWSVDRELNLISFNEPFAQKFRDDDGGIVVSGNSVFPPAYSTEKRLRFKELYDRALGGESFTETRYETIPEQRWSEISFFPIYKEGNIVGTACFFKNITRAKLAEEVLRNMRDDLNKRVLDLEQFAYIVSHNLRAPVANILGAVCMLDNPAIKANKKAVLNRGLNESVLKLDGVIKDLNNILKVKREITEIMEAVYFSELTENIKISIKNLIDKDSILILYNFSEINELVTLKNYLYSIFYNLITNSIKYRRPAVPCTIAIKSHIENDKIVLTFTDNGMGIDLNKNGHQVFGLYKRFHENINGKGVGLYMVKTQVETLGGTIAVKSEINKGATFIIEFKI